ncbi:MAG: AAA family ATPase, partial [Blastocatellia bacterium]
MPNKPDWKLFLGNNTPHDGIRRLPQAPTWRSFAENDDERRGQNFRVRPEMIEMVNAALYLRRPLLITGKPGVGKSSLIYAVAYELNLGKVLRWPITSRATLQGGLYRYDAIGRLQRSQIENAPANIGDHLSLGPLGTALLPADRPRALLIDEIDKSDFDLPNDLLDVFEEGRFAIPELERMGEDKVTIKDYDGNKVELTKGRVNCRQFPFVVMTSNGERDFPAPFLRRCLQLDLQEPKRDQLEEIVKAHFNGKLPDESAEMIGKFLALRDDDRKTVATDQLLNAVFLVKGRELGTEEE